MRAAWTRGSCGPHGADNATSPSTTAAAARLLAEATASLLLPGGVHRGARLIAQTADEFMRNEVLPALDGSRRRTGRSRARCSGAAGELGLLGVDVPEALGGVGLDKVSVGHRRRS